MWGEEKPRNFVDARSGWPDCTTSLRRAPLERSELDHHSSNSMCLYLRYHTTRKVGRPLCRPQVPGHGYTLSLCSAVLVVGFEKLNKLLNRMNYQSKVSVWHALILSTHIEPDFSC